MRVIITLPQHFAKNQHFEEILYETSAVVAVSPSSVTILVLSTGWYVVHLAVLLDWLIHCGFCRWWWLSESYCLDFVQFSLSYQIDTCFLKHHRFSGRELRHLPLIKSLSNHFGLCISLGTCVINQFSNQALNICSLHFKNVFGLLLTFNGPIGLRSLFRPSRNRFGVIRSRFSRSPVMFSMAQSRLLMGFEISAVRVSHWSIDSRLFMIVFELILWSVEFFALLSRACDEPPLDIAHNRRSSAGEVVILRLGSLFS